MSACAVRQLAPLDPLRYPSTVVLRRLARRLLLLVAVLGLMPGVDEIVEQVAELAEHHHLAHSVPGEADPLGEEHGCSPVEHHCRCHQGQSVELRDSGRLGAGAPMWLTWMLDMPGVRVRADNAASPGVSDRLAQSRANAPPTPPPNA